MTKERVAVLGAGPMGFGSSLSTYSEWLPTCHFRI